VSGWDIHTFTIKRLVLPMPQDATGGQIRTYTAAARGTLPKTVTGRAVRLKDSEKIDHGVRGEKVGWKLLTQTNPEITLEDRVEFDYVPGQPVAVKVTAESHARLGTTSTPNHYTTAGEDDSTEV
jgi:hypothetical protein